MASPGLPVSVEVWSATSGRQERGCQHQLVDGILHSMRPETTAAEDKKYTCVNRVKIISAVNFFAFKYINYNVSRWPYMFVMAGECLQSHTEYSYIILRVIYRIL